MNDLTEVSSDMAFALTRVVAALDDDPWGDSGDVLLTRAMADELRLAHQQAHAIRRGLAAAGAVSVDELMYRRAEEALRRSGGCYVRAAAEIGKDVATLYRWRKAGKVRW